jgi:hypothetical protein
MTDSKLTERCVHLQELESQAEGLLEQVEKLRVLVLAELQDGMVDRFEYEPGSRAAVVDRPERTTVNCDAFLKVANAVGATESEIANALKQSVTLAAAKKVLRESDLVKCCTTVPGAWRLRLLSVQTS